MMDTWRDPGDPDPQPPPGTPDDERSPFERPPFERPPFERDPEAQRAPGGGQEDPDRDPSPMQATRDSGPDAIPLDAPGIAEEPVGNDNIREGRVNGVMGPPHASNGQGQGG